jgi:hypothetical protein
VVKIFEKYGWSWGGDWKYPDYQHFSKSGDINKRIKDKLYSDLVKTYNKGKIDRFKDFVKLLPI